MNRTCGYLWLHDMHLWNHPLWFAKLPRSQRMVWGYLHVEMLPRTHGDVGTVGEAKVRGLPAATGPVALGALLAHCAQRGLEADGAFIYISISIERMDR